MTKKKNIFFAYLQELQISGSDDIKLSFLLAVIYTSVSEIYIYILGNRSTLGKALIIRQEPTQVVAQEVWLAKKLG
jgi:hypothetical protein